VHPRVFVWSVSKDQIKSLSAQKIAAHYTHLYALLLHMIAPPFLYYQLFSIDKLRYSIGISGSLLETTVGYLISNKPIVMNPYLEIKVHFITYTISTLCWWLSWRRW